MHGASYLLENEGIYFLVWNFFVNRFGRVIDANSGPLLLFDTFVSLILSAPPLPAKNKINTNYHATRGSRSDSDEWPDPVIKEVENATKDTLLQLCVVSHRRSNNRKYEVWGLSTEKNPTPRRKVELNLISCSV